MRDELDTRQEVQLLRVLEKVVKIRMPIIILSGNNVSEPPLSIMNTKKKIPVSANGSKSDQK